MAYTRRMAKFITRQKSRHGILLALAFCLSLRAFGLPVEMQTHEAHSTLLSLAVADEDSTPTCHTGEKPAPGTPSLKHKVCQILCDITCAPLLLTTQPAMAQDRVEARPPVSVARLRGVLPAPEHPPPIA